MDWSKTKTIFIGVFLILNIFLYSQYLDSYTEAQKVEIPGEKTTEAKLKEDNITYVTLPTTLEEASFISGSVKNFHEDEVPYFDDQEIVIENNSKLIITLEEPIKLDDITKNETFTDFVKTYVFEGSSYVLWNVDHEKQEAVFFQSVNNHMLYSHMSSYVKIYWNAEGKVYMFEQTMLEKLKEYEKKVMPLTPIQTLQVLYSKNLLKTGSHITSMKLGYSTHFQLTQTQVFAPTWEVSVTTAEDINEKYFVNAVEHSVIDIELDVEEVDQ